jgi:hypothetical protein
MKQMKKEFPSICFIMREANFTGWMQKSLKSLNRFHQGIEARGIGLEMAALVERI